MEEKIPSTQDSCEFEPIACIASDPLLAGIVSLNYGAPGRYLALLEAPRPFRTDISNEITERENAIRMLGAQTVLLLGLSPEEKQKIFERASDFPPCIVIDSYEDLFAFIKTDREIRKRGMVSGNPYVAALLKGSELPVDAQDLTGIGTGTDTHDTEAAIVCTEPGLSLMSLTAANYAWALGYLFRELRTGATLTALELEAEFSRVDEQIAGYQTDGTPPPTIASLKERLSLAIDRSVSWPEGLPICFFTKAAPYGLLFPGNPTSHVMELEAGLNTAYSLSRPRIEALADAPPCHTMVFVDPQWGNIYSETNDILGALPSRAAWPELVLGEEARCKTVELYAGYYPYDLLYVSSHGTAPKYRWNKYAFTASDGLNHEIVTHEFEYFSAYDARLVEVAQRTYPLSVDGVSWDDKEGLEAINGGETFAEFMTKYPHDRSIQRVEHHWVENTRVEGILLRDGVFFGGVFGLAASGYPVVVLNCCSMWTPLAEQIVHARCRGCILTLWQVGDKSGAAFGTTFLRLIREKTIVEAVFDAKRACLTPVFGDAFLCYSWPHCRLPRVDDNSRIQPRQYVRARVRLALRKFLERLPIAPSPMQVIQICRFLGERLAEIVHSGGSADRLTVDESEMLHRVLELGKQSAPEKPEK